MTELDPDVLPVVMPLVRRFLESAESATRDDLIAALTPAGLVQRADDDRSRHVGPTVRALESVGIVELRDGTLRLATPGLDEPAFRLDVARRLLRVPEGVDPWQARANAQRLEYDLEVAVVWFCLQGLTPALRDFDSADRRLRAQLGGERNLLRDGAPYGTLERWVVWLGVGSRVVVGDAAALVPDPTPLFRSALDELAPRGERVTAGQFLDASADLFPWLPHGRLGRLVAARLNEVPDDSADHHRIPSCVSLALVRLEGTGDVVLGSGDDPGARVSFGAEGSSRDAIAWVERG